jgi:transposase
VTGKAFETYLKELSRHKPNQYKIVVIDNARFHSTQNITVPDNIKLVNIPPYRPELNPCEQVWRYIKDRFKNKSFNAMKDIKKWLHEFVENMSKELIKSIVSNHHYLNAYMRNI